MTAPRIYKVVTFFCGLGAKTLGLLRARSRAGSRFESVGAFDVDAIACKDFELLTGAMAQVVDLGKLNSWELAKRCEGVPDVVVMSPPCLPPEGIVLTELGPRRIDNVLPGERVLSHLGRYCRVDKINRRRYVGRLHGITVQGTVEPQWYTDEHPIWARSYKHKRPLSPPEWRASSSIKAGDRVGFPVPLEVAGTAERFFGQFGDPRLVDRNGTSFLTSRIADLRQLASSRDMWLILGMYIGDGHRRPARNEVTLSLGAVNGRKFRIAKDALERRGLPHRVDLEHGEGNARIRMEGRHISMLCGEFGDGAANKRIPELLFGLELDLLASLLLGLRLTDGDDRSYGWRLVSISRELLLGVQRALLRIGQVGLVSWAARAGTAVIEGRTVQTADRFALDVRLSPSFSTYKFEDGAVWLRVKDVQARDYDGDVCNLEVDDDDTYCSPLIATHNCKGFSGCLPESLSKLEKYEALNRLALQSVKLAIKAWPGALPKLILLENVPRMITRGADWLAKITKLLRKSGYEVSLEPHDCGEWGGLAQKRERLLLIARLRSACPSHLLRPPALGLLPMASVLWQLPPPVPGSTAGPHHRLPQINALNWLRLAAIPAGQDWRAIPDHVNMVDVDPRLPEDGKRHAGKYGPQDPSQPAHTVIAEARTGKGWSDIADPRCGGDPHGRQSGLYGVSSSEGPSHTVVAAARAGSHSWASVTDPRLDDRGARQNGGYGVNDSGRSSHSVLAEGSVRNTWSSVSDPRAEPRFADCIRKGPLEHGDGAIDPRSTCSRFEDAIGVSDTARPYKTPVIGHQKVENSPSSVADPRVLDPRVPAQNRGNFGVQDPRRPSATIRAQHPVRTAPSSVADGRELFRPTHDLVAGQPWTGDRDAWVRGDFRLVGPEVAITKGGRGCYLIIRSFDGTVHRPMTTAELMLLQGIPVWHRPGDPTELALDDPTGQWVQLGGSDALVREHVGNAVPVPTAQAIGEVMLEVLDAGASEVFRLSSGGIWVQPEAMAAA